MKGWCCVLLCWSWCCFLNCHMYHTLHIWEYCIYWIWSPGDTERIQNHRTCPHMTSSFLLFMVFDPKKAVCMSEDIEHWSVFSQEFVRYIPRSGPCYTLGQKERQLTRKLLFPRRLGSLLRTWLCVLSSSGTEKTQKEETLGWFVEEWFIEGKMQDPVPGRGDARKELEGAKDP